MSQPPFIWPEILTLLEHYKIATQVLYDATPEAISEADGFPFSSAALPELDGQGMESLLKSQCQCLLDLYEARISGQGDLDLACLHIRHRLKDIEQGSHSRLYAYQFDEVPFYWRQIYSDAQILTTFHILLQVVDKNPPYEQRQAFVKALDEVVARLDRCLVTVGGAGRLLGKTWIENTLEMLGKAWRPTAVGDSEKEFSTVEPYPRPQLTKPIARCRGWGIARFEQYMKDGHALATTTGLIGPEPVIFTDLTKDVWPAIREKRWCRPDYLFRQTIGGRRMVPVEIGRSYVDHGWGQQLLPFKEFVIRYIDSSLAVDEAASVAADLAANSNAAVAQPGYLAQHDLFSQIPQLKNDIQIPDFCWADIPDRSPFSNAPPKPKLQMPEVNAWFGPPRTITPLHTDGYTNLFCQVVGTKYVRLYPPQADRLMRPRSRDENGIDMSNTSAIDIGALEGWDVCIDDTMDVDDEDAQAYIEEVKNSLKDVEYFECILEPGDVLLIPVGWWHYVRSLSVSFSVSYWWN
ncbi:hypothetical protein PWT90_07408 [Aphanocladium album]|nr:hypothetical protein PWT90_07408 [Aphanocladium album]